MTLEEVKRSQAAPEYVNSGRIAVLVYEDGNEFVSSWDGVEVRAGNPFGLDGKLTTEAGCPSPRNLYCVSREDYEKGLDHDQH